MENIRDPHESNSGKDPVTGEDKSTIQEELFGASRHISQSFRLYIYNKSVFPSVSPYPVLAYSRNFLIYQSCGKVTKLRQLYNSLYVITVLQSCVGKIGESSFSRLLSKKDIL